MKRLTSIMTLVVLAAAAPWSADADDATGSATAASDLSTAGDWRHDLREFRLERHEDVAAFRQERRDDRHDLRAEIAADLDALRNGDITRPEFRDAARDARHDFRIDQRQDVRDFRQDRRTDVRDFRQDHPSFRPDGQRRVQAARIKQHSVKMARRNAASGS